MQLDDVRLDLPVPDDVAALHRIYADPRVWTHFPSRRHTDVARTEELVRGWARGWERDGLSAWIVRDVTTGELLGHAGCALTQGSFWNLGYRLAPDAHGRGIATAVSRHALAEAHAVAPAVPVVAYLLEHNRASARVAEKVGLVLQHRAPDAGNPDPDAIRLVYADRSLTPDQLDATMR